MMKSNSEKWHQKIQEIVVGGELVKVRLTDFGALGVKICFVCNDDESSCVIEPEEVEEMVDFFSSLSGGKLCGLHPDAKKVMEGLLDRDKVGKFMKRNERSVMVNCVRALKMIEKMWACEHKEKYLSRKL